MLKVLGRGLGVTLRRAAAASSSTVSTAGGGGSDAATQEKISSLVGAAKVVVFMKGIPSAPKCGFSNAVVQILKMHNVNYQAHDVLEDESIRGGVKEFTKWPTVPQVFINGEFVGGCDILLQMHQSGELIEELKKAGITSALLEKELNNT